MKRFKSIYFKNFMTVALALLLSFSLVAAIFGIISYSYIVSDKTRDMAKYAESAARAVSSYAGAAELDSLNVRTMLVFIAESGGYHILVTDEVGRVVSCSDRELSCPHIGQTVPASAVSAINSAGEYADLSRLGTVYDENRYVVGASLMQADYPESYSGFIFLSGSAEDISGVWRSLALIFAAVAAASLVIAFIVSYIATKRQAQPINEMARAAVQFGRGDFSVRVSESGRNDEIGALAHAFNRMAESLERGESARRDLIANVSHELKTPMTTITGFADGILDGTIPPEREREYLGVISSETKRLSRLVRGMLDMSQLQSGDGKSIRQEPFDLAEVIRLSLVSLESRITSRGLDVDASLPEEPVMTQGDMDSITQVVYNLIDNAVKFARPGTSIGVELWKEGAKAHVAVSNRGDTIPQEELPLIFDRFHKTDRSRSMDKDGVGLGLYIVKTILDSHGEDIYVMSHEGLTTFTFSLALARE